MGTVVAFLLSGGALVSGVAILVAKGMLAGTVSHYWKKHLARRDRARCPNEHRGWD